MKDRAKRRGTCADRGWSGRRTCVTHWLIKATNNRLNMEGHASAWHPRRGSFWTSDWQCISSWTTSKPKSTHILLLMGSNSGVGSCWAIWLVVSSGIHLGICLSLRGQHQILFLSCWMAELREEMKSAFYLSSWLRKWNTTLQSFQMLKLAMMHGFSVCSIWSSSLFPIHFSLSCLPDHCKWFPSFLFKWHLQMTGKSGRQWIWNWKRHWTEDNAIGSIIKSKWFEMSYDVKLLLCWNFMLIINAAFLSVILYLSR